MTYKLPANASATVLTNSSGGIESTRVPISELAQLVKGGNPKHRPLLEAGSQRTLGYWVKTKIDTVVSIDQQYQPWAWMRRGRLEGRPRKEKMERTG